MKLLQWMPAILPVLLWAGLAGAQAQAGIGSGQGSGTGSSKGVITIQTTSFGYTSSTTGRPYSADVVNESNRVLADGNRIHTETHGKVFRDSEGRMRNENEYIGGVKKTNITIFDPVARIRITLDPRNKTASVHHFPAPAFSAADPVVTHRPPAEVPRPPEGSTGPTSTSEDLGSKEIEGIVAFGTRSVQTFEAGRVGNEMPFTAVHEWWVSRELGISLLTVTEDPRFGQSTMRLINIQRGEPDSELFQVPPDYTVTDIPWQQ